MYLSSLTWLAVLSQLKAVPFWVRLVLSLVNVYLRIFKVKIVHFAMYCALNIVSWMLAGIFAATMNENKAQDAVADFDRLFNTLRNFLGLPYTGHTF